MTLQLQIQPGFETVEDVKAVQTELLNWFQNGCKGAPPANAPAEWLNTLVIQDPVKKGKNFIAQEFELIDPEKEAEERFQKKQEQEAEEQIQKYKADFNLFDKEVLRPLIAVTYANYIDITDQQKRRFKGLPETDVDQAHAKIHDYYKSITAYKDIEVIKKELQTLRPDYLDVYS